MMASRPLRNFSDRVFLKHKSKMTIRRCSVNGKHLGESSIFKFLERSVDGSLGPVCMEGVCPG